MPAPFLFSALSSRRLCRAFGVQVSGFRFHPSSLRHKPSEYNPPPAPPSGWSGTTLVPPWYLPIPIERPKKGVFNEASLYLLPIGSFLGISPWSGTPSPRRLSMSYQLPITTGGMAGKPLNRRSATLSPSDGERAGVRGGCVIPPLPFANWHQHQLSQNCGFGRPKEALTGWFRVWPPGIPKHPT